MDAGMKRQKKMLEHKTHKFFIFLTFYKRQLVHIDKSFNLKKNQFCKCKNSYAIVCHFLSETM